MGGERFVGELKGLLIMTSECIALRTLVDNAVIASWISRGRVARIRSLGDSSVIASA